MVSGLGPVAGLAVMATLAAAGVGLAGTPPGAGQPATSTLAQAKRPPVEDPDHSGGVIPPPPPPPPPGPPQPPPPPAPLDITVKFRSGRATLTRKEMAAISAAAVRIAAVQADLDKATAALRLDYSQSLVDFFKADGETDEKARADAANMVENGPGAPPYSLTETITGFGDAPGVGGSLGRARVAAVAARMIEASKPGQAVWVIANDAPATAADSSRRQVTLHVEWDVR